MMPQSGEASRVNAYAIFIVSALAVTGCRPDQSGAIRSPSTLDAAEVTAPVSGGTPQNRSEIESCVNGWLAARNFDEYGHPAGTMYAGGTPLFDEKTGESRDRLDYVFARHPEARSACPRESLER
jgi:hypothetical protein